MIRLLIPQQGKIGWNTNGFKIVHFSGKGMRIEKTVLVIDDDEDDVEMLQQALKLIDGNH